MYRGRGFQKAYQECAGQSIAKVSQSFSFWERSLGFRVFSVFLLFPGILFSQNVSNLEDEYSLSPNAQLALSVEDYRVTAGDIYTLSFSTGAQQVQYVIPVDTSYRIRVSNLGVVDATGKTFCQLKTKVETVVANNYPMGGVQFVLTQPAAFKVHIAGEVKSTREINAWALNRLSALAVPHNLTAYSSIRDITVKSSCGQTRVYDLFKAARMGDISQNPYLRPGDEITFNRIARSVTLEGAVERPGVYQILDGENLKDLIEYYGSGFTHRADKTRLDLVRLVNSGNVAGRKISLAESDIEANYGLENHDVVTVPDITLLEPVMFVEGAVGASAEANLTASNRLTVRFYRGENYAALVRRNMGWFSAVSDTKNAYIIRGDAQIPFNLNPVLYNHEYSSELRVEDNDVLIIPFRQYFVTVAGAVVAPGRYPYIPDRDWDYYIALAGGFRPEQNSRQSVEIVDITGKKLDKTDAISPETVITARANSFHYYFSQYAPVITTTLSLITTFITLQAYLNSR
jgi:protein involved in polysaccharide export with SLBB domain